MIRSPYTTRSQTSRTPSETDDKMTTGDPDTVQRALEKEKILSEQADALRRRQQEIEAREEKWKLLKTKPDVQELASILAGIRQELGKLNSVPEEVQNLKAHMNELQSQIVSQSIASPTRDNLPRSNETFFSTHNDFPGPNAPTAQYENNPSQQLSSNISGPKQNQNFQNLPTKSPGNADSVPAISGARPNATVTGHMNQNKKSVQFQSIAETPLLRG
ncbi:hypothetical protein DBV15_12768 [Temnothorax longispinosus]|uniref:Uncharacterized protein n=1 Tax=Temnothorax longispinosus TaxID=300112 RepID=A0A4S2K3B6_9HYME|nr:hypothetical protein DBV15_12768 [Temnothorax longispinosus]